MTTHAWAGENPRWRCMDCGTLMHAYVDPSPWATAPVGSEPRFCTNPGPPVLARVWSPVEPPCSAETAARVRASSEAYREGLRLAAEADLAREETARSKKPKGGSHAKPGG